MMDSESRRRKVGIMGGTFNPIHIGHLLLAQAALTEYDLDTVMFLPSGNSYMKDLSTVEEADVRMKMVQLAIEDNPKFFASDMEIKRKGNTYTCDTMKQLSQEFPNDHFYFICGADCLFSIEKWRSPQIIFDNCTLLAAVRDGIDVSQMEQKCEELRKKFQGEAFLLPFPETAISSTEIRKHVSENKSIRYMVSEEVRGFIEENHLYKS